MKRLLLLCFISTASAQTTYEFTTIPPTITTNTVLGNGTSATAAPQQLAVGTCSTAASALKWTTNTGFGCNTAIDATTLLTGTWAAPGTIGSGTPSTGAFTTLSATGVITSTQATGTAPFTVASTTNVANLNASSLGGATFAAPGAIGGGTPSTGAFTTISATGAITSTLANGSAPFVVASSTNVTNLNASTLSGATFANPGVIGTTPAIVHGTNMTSQPAAAATSDAGNVSYTLFSSGIPFIIDQCTLGVTAGLTSCTSLPQTFGKSYMYFNASILTSSGTGSTAGFYGVNMTSATAGQVCSPIVLYSTGSPTAVGTCNTFAPNATGTQTPPNTQITEANASMAGHSMGLNGRLKCETGTQQNNSAGTKSMVIKWGTATTTNTPTTITGSYVSVNVINSGDEAIQNYQNSSTSPTAATMQASAPGTPATVNTASTQTVGFFETLNTPSTDFSVVSPYACVVYPN